MKTIIIHGQSHKGSTYHVAHDLTAKIGGEIKEFFLPRDFGEFCIGCTRCFVEGEEHCPHHEKLSIITKEMDSSDIIILASPVYVFHATGAMKAFLDHLGYRWMVHRPEESMFSKIGVCISTAAGGGMKSANKDMGDSLFFWGVGRIYKLGFAVFEADWGRVSEKRKKIVDRKTSSIANNILKSIGKTKPCIKTRTLFYLIRFMMKRFGAKGNKKDISYWNEKGWTNGTRPWR